MILDDNYFMNEALKLANMSYIEEEVPVGAVIVKNYSIIAMGRNRREKQRNAISHAEVEAISNACKVLNGWRLFECELFVTLEPCPMCAGAIINSRIKRVVFGAKDPKSGSFGSIIDLLKYDYNHKPKIKSGILKKECSQILINFFKNLRSK